MKKRYIQILIFLSFIILFSPTQVSAQKQNKENLIKIESVVKDEKGNPITGAIIYGNEGAVIAKTDDSGKFTISVPDNTNLLIESEGYESAVYKSGEYANMKEFSLKSALFLHGEKDVVNIAFGKVKRGDLVNAVSVINPDELRKYDNMQGITEALSGRVPGLLYGANVRGLGVGLTVSSAMYIVDGLPRDISTINLSEVEQISVLKDINSLVLYGNGAVNGVIQIKTKRGQAYKKKVNVEGYYGISVPLALPKYLSSADYMELYNEAKVNDGLAPQYDAATIANYRFGNKYRYPSTDYYSKEYLKDYKPFSRVTAELSGGNDVATYYANVGWDRSGSLLNFGTGDKANQNKFNVRGNVDLKINSWIKSSLDAVVVMNSNKGPFGTSYWNGAATLRPNLFTPLIPISYVEKNDPTLTVKNRKNDVNGMYLLGGTAQNLTNPIADTYSGGTNENVQRTLSFNNRIDFDLKALTQGLAFHTNISFDFYTRYDQSVDNSYAVYQPNWNPAVDSIASFGTAGNTKLGNDTRTGNQNINNAYYERRVGFYGMMDYNRTFGVHQISGTLLGYANRYKVLGDFQGTKNVNLGLRAAYGFKNKYLVDFSSAYVNSVKLPPGNKGAFSPTLGLAWVISEESFMSQGSAINYLKLKASAGKMNSELGIDGFYYYDNSYTTSGSFSWNENGSSGSNSGVISSHGNNPKLGFEKRKEYNLGLEGIFFNRQLSVDANFFRSEYYDQITRPSTTFPSFYSTFLPYANFDSNQYTGAELGLAYDKKIGDFSFVLGANLLYADSKILKKDEIFNNAYQYTKGRPLDARYGLVSEGFFTDQTDIDNHAFQAFGQVKPGDIKYIDQNKDGIVDANDRVQIGRYQPPFSYGLNLKVSYKNLTLFARGNGSIGADGYLSDNYYWVDGDDKYSTFVLNRWTPETAATATVPRLSSVANPNNFQASSFWLYKDNYFSIDRVQLTYDVPEKFSSRLGMRYLSFYANASGLATFSKFKDFRQLRVGGSEPNYRSFSLGIKTTF